MPGAYWCMVEDDRQGAPKKVMAEVLGEATRVAGAAGAQAEAVWVTDRATPEGLKLLGEWGAKRIWLFENAAFAVNGEDVRIAGANVGSIESLDLTADRRRAAPSSRRRTGGASVTVPSFPTENMPAPGSRQRRPDS